MSFIENIPDHKIRDFAISTHERNQTLKDEKSKLHHEITSLKKQLGIQEDGFKDTPSLNLIFFNRGSPYCEEHGAMNCFENRIYRCVMCGVAVSLKNRQVLEYVVK